MTHPKATATIAVLLLAATLPPAGCDRIESWLPRTRCALSGRPIHSGMAVTIQVGDGPPKKACCLRCAITYAQQEEARVVVRSVTDQASGEQLAPEDAVYLAGSGLQPCAGPRVDFDAGRRQAPAQSWDRCLPSIIAFAHGKDAEKYREEWGGKTQTFAEIVDGTNVVAARTENGRSTAAPGGM